MKNALCFVVLLFALSNMAHAQLANEASRINLSVKYGSAHADVQDILSFENIDLFKLAFKGEPLINSDFILVAKEIWNGKITKVDTLFSSAEDYQENTITSDSLYLKVIGKKRIGKELKMLIKFPWFSLDRKFNAVDSEDYSLRILKRDKNTPIQLNSPFNLLAYMLPYEEKGWKKYCAVEDSGVDVENWGKRFGIEHYLVFQMEFH